MCVCVVVVIPVLTVAVILALILLIIVVACAVRYARKYCCCRAARRVGSYTPSPSPSAEPRAAIHHQRRPRRAPPLRRTAPGDAAASLPARAVQTRPAYRSVVVIGSERLARRVAVPPPSRDRPPAHWTVREASGAGTWGNLSQQVRPPPAAAAAAAVAAAAAARGPGETTTAAAVQRSRGEVDETGRTVTEIVSLLESRRRNARTDD